MKTSKNWSPAKLIGMLCAAIAIYSTMLVIRAQSFVTPAISQASDVIANSTDRLTNTYYTYPGFELWDPAKWAANKPKTEPITSWIETHEKGTQAEYEVKDKYKGIKTFVGNQDYTWKTENITDPEVTDPLTRMGLRVDVREGGGFSIFIAPEKVLADKTRKVPIVIVPHVVDKKDVFWAMNTLVHFRKYNELCAQRGDFIIVYFVIDKSDAGHSSPFGIIDQATDLYHGDYKRIYLDMSVFAENGAKVADVPGLDWSDDDGTKHDPETQIDHLGFIPVLNVAGKWNGKPSAGIGIARPRSDLRYDPQRILHGKLGEHWMEGISFLFQHGKNDDPRIKAHFDQLGIEYSQHDYEGERWIIFSPRQAVEQAKKLPLVLILSEVYPYD